jgi:peptidoglycan/xylan/chitin deacetylase (PgdA/CDA1 family)
LGDRGSGCRSDGAREMKKVTLTFDNGPDPDGTTAYVLDILSREHLKASFFVTGNQLSLRGARVLAERAHAEGHWIGNHTFTHSVMFGDSKDRALPEIEIGRTQEIIGELSHPNRFFRPYGAGGIISQRLLSADAVSYLAAGRYRPGCHATEDPPADLRPGRHGARSRFNE